MIKTWKAFTRDWTNSQRLENLDSETWQEIIWAKGRGNSFSFGEYDRRDGGLVVNVEYPEERLYDVQYDVQKEWEEKREFYLKHAGSDFKLYVEGESEGYITEDECKIVAGNADWVCGCEEEDGDYIRFLEKEHLRKIKEAERKRLIKPRRNLERRAQRFLKKVCQTENPWQQYEFLKNIFYTRAPTIAEAERLTQNALDVLKL